MTTSSPEQLSPRANVIVAGSVICPLTLPQGGVFVENLALKVRNDREGSTAATDTSIATLPPGNVTTPF